MNIRQKQGKIISNFSVIARTLFIIAGGLGLAACGGGGGGSQSSPGTIAVVGTSVISAGDVDCATGGVQVETGIDVNKSGVLDVSEVSTSTKVCNSGGLNMLVDVDPEPVGVNCPNAGQRIDAGIDANANTSLDSTEVTQTRFVCNGGIGWAAAELVETDNAGRATHPQVSVDASGNVLAVWYQSDGMRDNIWSNRYVAGTGWGTAELIETDNVGGALFPQVSVDASGNVVAVWNQYDGTRNNIWSNRYVAGTGWGIAELIEADDVESASSPQLSVDASGNAVAVWNQYDGTRNNIWSNRYVVGTGWGVAELIESDNVGAAYNPQVSGDASGNVVAVWYQSGSTGNNIWSNRYVVGTGWGTAELIETDNAGSASSPQVSVDTSGNALAVWYQSDGTRRNIWSNRYVVGTGWGVAELIETVNAGDAQDPQIAVDSSGNAVAVWYQVDGSRENIWSNRYAVGTGWATAELIEIDNAGDANHPQVLVDSSGNAVVVWAQSNGTRTNIWSNRWQAP